MVSSQWGMTTPCQLRQRGCWEEAEEGSPHCWINQSAWRLAWLPESMLLTPHLLNLSRKEAVQTQLLWEIFLPLQNPGSRPSPFLQRAVMMPGETNSAKYLVSWAALGDCWQEGDRQRLWWRLRVQVCTSPSYFSMLHSQGAETPTGILVLSPFHEQVTLTISPDL